MRFQHSSPASGQAIATQSRLSWRKEAGLRTLQQLNQVIHIVLRTLLLLALTPATPKWLFSFLLYYGLCSLVAFEPLKPAQDILITLTCVLLSLASHYLRSPFLQLCAIPLGATTGFLLAKLDQPETRSPSDEPLKTMRPGAPLNMHDLLEDSDEDFDELAALIKV